jgi:hypothetical protein
MALALSLQETNGSAADILDSDNEASDADSDTPPSSPYQGQLMDMGVSGRYVCLLAHGTHARYVGAVAGGHTVHGTRVRVACSLRIKLLFNFNHTQGAKPSPAIRIRTSAEPSPAIRIRTPLSMQLVRPVGMLVRVGSTHRPTTTL